MAQLVIIPAAIVVVCIALAWLFAFVASAKDDIDTHLLKLRQSSGAGKLALGLQDPRYKDRSLAAYNIATMIPTIDDPSEKHRISDALIEILNQHVAPNEDLLQHYMLVAIGQLGQPNGLETLLEQLQADQTRARQGAIRGLLSWPDAQQARRGLAPLQRCLSDPSPSVRYEAAAALGQLATPTDQATIQALRTAMENATGLAMREARWNAAVALAKLGDPAGSHFVATVLLNREALSQMPAGDTGPQANQVMSPAMADRIILPTLASIGGSKDPQIWDKIQQIADNDPSRTIRNAAKQLIMNREQQP